MSCLEVKIGDQLAGTELGKALLLGATAAIILIANFSLKKRPNKISHRKITRRYIRHKTIKSIHIKKNVYCLSGSVDIRDIQSFKIWRQQNK